MTGKEVVYRTIEFNAPSRIALAKGEDSDIVYVSHQSANDFRPSEQGMDEWGCLWKTFNPELFDQGQVIKNPLKNWEAFENYKFPDPYAPGRFDSLPKQLSNINLKEKFIVGNLGHGPMHLLAHLRSFDEFLIDLMIYPERTEVLLDGIFYYLTGIAKQYKQYGVDAVIMYDDQAIQTGPLFSMDLWRKYFKPRYKKLFDAIHDCGLKVYMHTCGHIGLHLPELYECGVDILDNKQPSLWIDDKVVKDMRGKIAFSTCIDIQTTIHNIEMDDIEGEVQKLIQTLSVPEGGFVATYYQQEDLMINNKKIEEMMMAFKKFKWTVL